MATLLSVNNYYYRRGGAESVFLEHNNLLKEQGWQVVPFSMQHPQNFDSEWSGYFVSEIEYGKSCSVFEKLRKGIRSVYSFEARRKVERLIDAVNPDICHGHNIYHHISPAILESLKRHDIPVVITLHDLKLACPAYSMLNSTGVCERCKDGKTHHVVGHRCMKGSLALSCLIYAESILHKLLGSYADNVDCFVVPSRFYKSKMNEWGWDTGRFHHISNFIDPDSYVPDFDPGDGFVYFGRLCREKGLRTLVKAAAIAGVTVDLVGSGPEEADLRAFVARTNAKVRFLGYRAGESLHSVIRGARACVLASEWYENAPISILESYALGKPVIGARIGGIPELIHDGGTGMTFRSGSAEDLADVLLKFRNMSSEEIGVMGRRGRRLVELEYSRENYLDNIKKLYSGLGVVA